MNKKELLQAIEPLGDDVEFVLWDSEDGYDRLNTVTPLGSDFIKPHHYAFHSNAFEALKGKAVALLEP